MSSSFAPTKLWIGGTLIAVFFILFRPISVAADRSAQIAMEQEEDEDQDEDIEENVPPSITEFSVVFDEYTDEWVFSGVVDDEDPDGCVVEFGVLLDGFECDVDENGNFELRIQLEDDEAGVVSVEAEDEFGEVSEEELDEVDFT